MANFDIFSDTTPKNLVKRPAGPTIAALRTALSTYSASTYTTAALNAMAKNDMVYAATVYGLTVAGMP
jgi:hypothetical protein